MPHLLISCDGNFIQWWEFFILFLAIFNSISIPFQVFYKREYTWSLLKSREFQILDAVIDLLFLIDIIVQFRTTYIDTVRCKVECDPHKIAKNYLAGSFWIDFISSFPFGNVFEGVITSTRFVAILQALGLLKLLRLGRIYPAVRKLNLHFRSKIVIKIALMTFFIIIALHFASAMWFYFVQTDQRWVHNKDFPEISSE